MFEELSKIKSSLGQDEARAEADYVNYLVRQYEEINNSYKEAGVPLRENMYHLAAKKISVHELAGTKVRGHPANGEKLLRSCYNRYRMATGNFEKAKEEAASNGKKVGKGAQVRLTLKEARYVLASLLDSIIETTLLVPTMYKEVHQ